MSTSIAFFDVDNTIVSGNTGFYTSLRLVKHGILKKRRIPQAIYFAIASKLFNQDVKNIYNIAIKDMAGTTLERVLQIGRECFENDIRKRVYPQALELIRAHQAKGDKVVFLSAGPYMTLKIMQQEYQIDEAYTMGPEIVGGILLNKLRVPICHGEGKVIFAQEYAERLGIDLKSCHFYSDHHSDLPLLEKIGYAHVVNPSRKLARQAQQKGWKIHYFKS